MKKRLLNRVTGAAIWILFLLGGGAVIYSNLFGVQEGLLGLFRAEGARLQAMTIGSVMVLLSVLYVLTIVPARPRLRFVTFESDEGEVSISVHAVRDFIRKIGDEFSAIHQIDPKIHADRDQIRIDLDVKIVSGSRVPELSQLLQARVREGIRDGLGIAEVRVIKVRVQEIIGEPPTSREDLGNE